jgi:hypothetical protein
MFQGQEDQRSACWTQTPHTLDDSDGDGSFDRSQVLALQDTSICGVSSWAVLSGQHKALRV